MRYVKIKCSRGPQSFLAILLFIIYVSFGFIAINQQRIAILTECETNTGGPRTNICRIPPLQSIHQYNNFINNRQRNCSRWIELGGGFGSPDDGKKFICMDTEFHITPGSCVVLSFGINNEWSFEEDAARLGCQVYAFDPTLGLEDHQRSANIHFYNLGISNDKGWRKIGMNQIPTDFNFTKEYPVDTYENILAMLGLKDTKIDIVKMDVELSEIYFFQDVLYNNPHLLQNIKQMAVEIHHDVITGDIGPRSIQQIYWIIYHQLKCHGFNIYMSRHGGFFREVVWGQIDQGSS